MRTRVTRWIAIAIAALSAACAADVGDIDRTQPNRVDKSIFMPDPATGKERVWYYRATVTDVPFSTGFAFIGQQGDVEKVVWDIQEHLLVAYRSYEWTRGAEQYATRPGNRYRGAPVAAFPILSHFDVQREYNPATGEQTNVISENTTDRPWNERAYMRVDWGDNRIADFRFPTAEANTQALYFVQPTDPNAKDRPIITPTYVDVTAQLMVEPELVDVGRGQKIPRCYLWSELTKDCLGQAIKVRHSFMLASEDPEAYEPLPYDSKSFAKFGYFSSKRFVYDRERDLLEGTVEQYAERFNIWLKSRTCTASGCTSIPLENRALRPVVWYVNDQFPRTDTADGPGLLEQAQRVADGWNDVFTDAVRKAWALGGREQAPSRIVYLCRNNPVTDDDTNLAGEVDLSLFEGVDAAGNRITSVPFPDEAKPQNKLCGPKGTNPQIGDLRYSMQFWVPNPQASAPLGYGPHAADPETGRVVQANAFIYGAGMETYASYVADTVALMNGDLSETELSQGEYLRALLEERLGQVPEVVRSPAALRALAKDQQLGLRSATLREQARRGELNHDYVTANLKAMDQTWSANILLTDELVRGLTDGDGELEPVTQEQRDALKPSTWANPAALNYGRERIKRLSEANITAADFFDDSILSRALKMKEKYGDLDERERFKAIRSDLLREMYLASELHEVGHTFGLRHNFAASADALNYVTAGRPGVLTEDLEPRIDDMIGEEIDPKNYWSIRPFAGGSGALLQPSYMVPFLPEMMARYPMKELQYSSIMDYSAKPNGDLFGLGKYDGAAIRFAYTGLVDVFDPAAAGPDFKNATLPANLGATLKAGEVHYTYLPYLFAGSEVESIDIVKRGIRLMTEGRRTMRWSDLQAAVRAGHAPVEVPYLFCSDEYVGGSSACYRFDEGPDMYEMVRNVQEMYENNYWFNNFKRGRVRFALGGSTRGYTSRIYDRYFSVLSNQYKHFVNDELIIRSERGTKCAESLGASHATADLVEHYQSPLCGLDQYVSTLATLNFFGRVLSTPDVGSYGFDTATGSWRKDFKPEAGTSGTTPAPLDIKVGTGKFAETAYDREQYGYDFFYKPVVIGSWWDKYMAVMALGDPYTNFIGLDSGSDTLSYLINFNDLFYREVNNMVGGFAIQDYASYAPMVNAKGKFVPRAHVKIYTSDVTDTTGMTFVNPEERYTARLIAAYMGISLFSDAKSDTKFINSIRINVAGMGESASVPDAIKTDASQYVEILDPDTQRTYWAVRYGYRKADGTPDTSTVPLGFTLLSQVKARVTDATTGAVDPVKLRQELHYVDILRGMVHDWEYVRGL